MRLIGFTDNHYCENKGIINTYGTRFSHRLENQIQSLNWVEQMAIEHNCDAIFCAGDFFDKAQLNDKEITALTTIKWSNLPHYFLVGNHDSEALDLKYSVVKALEQEAQNRFVISEACTIEADNTEICFLPYVTERDRGPLTDYFGPKQPNTKRIIISHNDIRGIQMGPVISAAGFSIEEFEEMADLVINGHLHNGTAVSRKVLNLGNLTGKDFGEDAEKYPHRVIIIDTNTGSCEFIENPYAFNFYKRDVAIEADLAFIDRIKTNSVLGIKYEESLHDKLVAKLEANKSKIFKTRLTPYKIIKSTTEVEAIDVSDLTVEHLPRFVECVREKLGTDPVIEAELAEICK